VTVDTNTRRKLLAGAAAVAVVAGGGGALAASKLNSPKEESQAVIADAAGQLGITPAKLTDALKTALENRVDAAVAAGRLTKADGEAMKARIESGDVPLLGGGPRERFGHHGPDRGAGLDAAATYLGLTEDQLRTELERGKTLAQIATAHGKTAEGLVSALLDRAKQRLDAAVAAGRLTRPDADSLLAGLKDRITDLVNGRFPQPLRDHHGPRGFPHGPPGLFGP
jgi:hypothetical protein